VPRPAQSTGSVISVWTYVSEDGNLVSGFVLFSVQGISRRTFCCTLLPVWSVVWSRLRRPCRSTLLKPGLMFCRWCHVITTATDQIYMMTTLRKAWETWKCQSGNLISVGKSLKLTSSYLCWLSLAIPLWVCAVSTKIMLSYRVGKSGQLGLSSGLVS